MQSTTYLQPDKAGHRSHRIDLSIGERISICARSHAELSVLGENDNVQLRIVWQNGRAVVQLQEADLQIEQAHDVSVRCHTFRVQADRDVSLAAGHQVEIQAERRLHLRSEVIDAFATLGDLLLRANDFVRVLGEKILLNTERDPQEAEKRQRDFLRRFFG